MQANTQRKMERIIDCLFEFVQNKSRKLTDKFNATINIIYMHLTEIRWHYPHPLCIRTILVLLRDERNMLV